MREMQIPWSMVHYRNGDSYLQDSAERPCRAGPGGMDSLFLDRCNLVGGGVDLP